MKTMRHHPLLSSIAAVALPAFLLACSSDTGPGRAGGLGSGGSGSGATGSGATGSGATGSGATGVGGAGGTPVIAVGGGTTGGSAGAAGGAAGGTGLPELCDGVDNDGNGVIDDVDAGGDGVCDCLNIGTIGSIGPWSDGGNIFANWLNARTPLGAVALGDQVLTSELLAPLQVIVVLHASTIAAVNDGAGRMAPANHAFSDAEASAFGAWVRNGGGAMTTIGYNSDEAAEVVNVNRLLGSIGMGYSTTDLDLTDFVETWDAHPVTMGVTNIFTDNGVEPRGGGAVVARGDSNRVALEVLQVDSGRAVVWGDEWITYDSEWEDVQGQQVELFWLNILKWLSPPLTCQVPIPPDVVR